MATGSKVEKEKVNFPCKNSLPMCHSGAIN